MKINVVHVDDDALFIEHFREMICQVPGFHYQQGFTDPETAYAYLQGSTTPYLVFLDIEMGLYNGFWLAEKLNGISSDIVFVTAHTGYALQAFEACAVDYLVKPVTPSKIAVFAERYRLLVNKRNLLLSEQLNELYGNYLEARNAPSRIFIKTTGKIDIIDLQQVLYFSSKGNFTEVYMQDGTKHTSGKNIKTYEDAIARNRDFVRIHRSFIINRVHVKSIIRNSKKHKFSVVMVNNDELEMSFLKKDEIIALLLQDNGLR